MLVGDSVANDILEVRAGGLVVVDRKLGLRERKGWEEEEEEKKRKKRKRGIHGCEERKGGEEGERRRGRWSSTLFLPFSRSPQKRICESGN